MSTQSLPASGVAPLELNDNNPGSERPNNDIKELARSITIIPSDDMKTSYVTIMGPYGLKALLTVNFNTDISTIYQKAQSILNESYDSEGLKEAVSTIGLWRILAQATLPPTESKEIYEAAVQTKLKDLGIYEFKNFQGMIDKANEFKNWFASNKIEELPNLSSLPLNKEQRQLLTKHLPQKEVAFIKERNPIAAVTPMVVVAIAICTAAYCLR